MKIINIGILAHVDAGKTTLTESLLYASGAISEPGSVEKGTTRTDTMFLERQRGITIQAAVTSFQWHRCNQTTINNLTESQTKGVSGGPSAPYGRYGNIFLSQTEYDELQAEYPDRLERFIEEMSRYLAANGKSYQNYAAALRIWAGNDKKEAPKKGIPDYSCKEGESL